MSARPPAVEMGRGREEHGAAPGHTGAGRPTHHQHTNPEETTVTTLTDFNVAERVADGAALLDDRLPGWWERIDLDRLDLASPCRCVLGQLEIDRAGEEAKYGDPYGDALDYFDINAHEDEALGFDNPDREYVALTAAWRELILARRAEATS